MTLTVEQWAAAGEWAAREIRRGRTVEECAREAGVPAGRLQEAVRRHEARAAGEARRAAEVLPVMEERLGCAQPVDVYEMVEREVEEGQTDATEEVRMMGEGEVREAARRLVEFLARGLTVRDLTWRRAGLRRMCGGWRWCGGCAR